MIIQQGISITMTKPTLKPYFLLVGACPEFCVNASNAFVVYINEDPPPIQIATPHTSSNSCNVIPILTRVLT